MTAAPDPGFAHPRLAATYDVFEGPRDDLDHYEAILDEFGARRVLDVGCGTGEFACRLARRDIAAVGVDPAAASIEIARGKPGSDAVTWIVGDATAVASHGVEPFDVAVMTANVAQVFLTDDDWNTTLRSIRAVLRPGGVLVFESRDPEQRAWEGWSSEAMRASATLPDGDVAENWCLVTDVDEPFVTFRSTTHFESDGEELVSDSTLRFRTRDELTDSLTGAGYDVVDIRDAPDRPGREFVFIARRR